MQGGVKWADGTGARRLALDSLQIEISDVSPKLPESTPSELGTGPSIFNPETSVLLHRPTAPRRHSRNLSPAANLPYNSGPFGEQ